MPSHVNSKTMEELRKKFLAAASRLSPSPFPPLLTSYSSLMSLQNPLLPVEAPQPSAVDMLTAATAAAQAAPPRPSLNRLQYERQSAPDATPPAAPRERQRGQQGDIEGDDSSTGSDSSSSDDAEQRTADDATPAATAAAPGASRSGSLRSALSLASTSASAAASAVPSPFRCWSRMSATGEGAPANSGGAYGACGASPFGHTTMRIDLNQERNSTGSIHNQAAQMRGGLMGMGLRLSGGGSGGGVGAAAAAHSLSTDGNVLSPAAAGSCHAAAAAGPGAAPRTATDSTPAATSTPISHYPLRFSFTDSPASPAALASPASTAATGSGASTPRAPPPPWPGVTTAAAARAVTAPATAVARPARLTPVAFGLDRIEQRQRQRRRCGSRPCRGHGAYGGGGGSTREQHSGGWVIGSPSAAAGGSPQLSLQQCSDDIFLSSARAGAARLSLLGPAAGTSTSTTLAQLIEEHAPVPTAEDVLRQARIAHGSTMHFHIGSMRVPQTKQSLVRLQYTTGGVVSTAQSTAADRAAADGSGAAAAVGSPRTGARRSIDAARPRMLPANAAGRQFPQFPSRGIGSAGAGEDLAPPSPSGGSAVAQRLMQARTQLQQQMTQQMQGHRHSTSGEPPGAGGALRPTPLAAQRPEPQQIWAVDSATAAALTHGADSAFGSGYSYSVYGRGIPGLPVRGFSGDGELGGGGAGGGAGGAGALRARNSGQQAAPPLPVGGVEAPGAEEAGGAGSRGGSFCGTPAAAAAPDAVAVADPSDPGAGQQQGSAGDMSSPLLALASPTAISTPRPPRQLPTLSVPGALRSGGASPGAGGAALPSPGGAAGSPVPGFLGMRGSVHSAAGRQRRGSLSIADSATVSPSPLFGAGVNAGAGAGVMRSGSSFTPRPPQSASPAGAAAGGVSGASAPLPSALSRTGASGPGGLGVAAATQILGQREAPPTATEVLRKARIEHGSSMHFQSRRDRIFQAQPSSARVQFGTEEDQTVAINGDGVAPDEPTQLALDVPKHFSIKHASHKFGSVLAGNAIFTSTIDGDTDDRLSTDDTPTAPSNRWHVAPFPIRIALEKDPHEPAGSGSESVTAASLDSSFKRSEPVRSDPVYAMTATTKFMANLPAGASESGGAVVGRKHVDANSRDAWAAAAAAAGVQVSGASFSGASASGGINGVRAPPVRRASQVSALSMGIPDPCASGSASGHLHGHSWKQQQQQQQRSEATYGGAGLIGGISTEKEAANTLGLLAKVAHTELRPAAPQLWTVEPYQASGIAALRVAARRNSITDGHGGLGGRSGGGGDDEGAELLPAQAAAPHGGPLRGGADAPRVPRGAPTRNASCIGDTDTSMAMPPGSGATADAPRPAARRRGSIDEPLLMQQLGGGQRLPSIVSAPASADGVCIGSHGSVEGSGSISSQARLQAHRSSRHQLHHFSGQCKLATPEPTALLPGHYNPYAGKSVVAGGGANDAMEGAAARARSECFAHLPTPAAVLLDATSAVAMRAGGGAAAVDGGALAAPRPVTPATGGRRLSASFINAYAGLGGWQVG
eukprot:XP_001696059.1 predicted protein [Chlamydomonas reinhardtii]